MSKLTWAIVVDENAYTESVPGKTGYRLGLNALPSDKKLFKDINPFVFIYYTPDEKSGQDESYLSLSGSEVSSLEYDKKSQKLDIELIDYDAGFLIENETFEVGVPTATKWIRQTNNHADYFEFTPTHIFVGTEMNHDSMKPFKEWLESFMDKHKYNPSTEGFPKTAESNLMKAEIDEVDDEVAIIRNQLGDSVGNIELEDRDVEDVSIEIYNDDGVLLEEIVLGAETFEAEHKIIKEESEKILIQMTDDRATIENAEEIIESLVESNKDYESDEEDKELFIYFQDEKGNGLRSLSYVVKGDGVNNAIIDWFSDYDYPIGGYTAETFEASGSGHFMETGGRMVTIDSDIEVNYNWQTDPYEIEDNYGEIQEKVEEKVREEYYDGNSGSGYMREEYLDEDNEYQDYEISYEWTKEVSDGAEEEIKSWAETDLSMNAETVSKEMVFNIDIDDAEIENEDELEERGYTQEEIEEIGDALNNVYDKDYVLEDLRDNHLDGLDGDITLAGHSAYLKSRDEMVDDIDASVYYRVDIGDWHDIDTKNAETFEDDELENLYGRQNYFTYNNLGSMAYNSLYMAARKLGATPIEAFNLCNSKWIRRNEDYIPKNMTEMFMNMMYRQGDNWKHYIEGDGDYQIEDYSKNTLWRDMKSSAEIRLQMNESFREAGIEGYDAENEVFNASMYKCPECSYAGYQEEFLEPVDFSGLRKNAETFEANAKSGDKVYVITRRCEDYSAYRELDVAVFGSKTEAKKKFNMLFKRIKNDDDELRDMTIAEAKGYMYWGEYWGIESFGWQDLIYELRECIVGEQGDFYFDAEGDSQ